MDLFDLFQQFRIEANQSDVMSVRAKAASAASETERLKMDVRVLANKLDHLSLLSMAMCELLEEVGFNKDMLEAKIREIDLRDGKLNGKLAESRSCSGCGREMATRHVLCLYCGKQAK